MRIKEKERRPRLEHRQHLYHMYQGASPMIQGHIELPICEHDQSTRFKYKKCRLIQSEKETTTWAKNPKSVFRCADYQIPGTTHSISALSYVSVSTGWFEVALSSYSIQNKNCSCCHAGSSETGFQWLLR